MINKIDSAIFKLAILLKRNGKQIDNKGVRI